MEEKDRKDAPKLRDVTRAPAPATALGGLGITHTRAPKASQIPHNPPTCFPSDLWPQTNVILLEAQRKFPLQTQTLELCNHIVGEMTPLFCEAVKTWKMEAVAVFHERRGGMEDLLHSLLVDNDDSPKSGFSSLSDRAYELGKRVRESGEWLALAKAIADAQSEAQHAIKPQSAKQSAAERIGRNIDRLKKECGWSYDKLAEKTGIDKKAILNHSHGKSRPRPGTLKEYAQAFTKELERPITANNLEE